MWSFLEGIAEAVTKYTTVLGKIWYVLVFVFRLGVVASLGGAVYQDEQSMFQCSTDANSGCKLQCYNEFAKISHMRFWGFQLLAVIAPTVCFHFYCLYVKSDYEKLKKTKSDIREIQGGNQQVKVTRREVRKIRRREARLGKVHERRVVVGRSVEVVPMTWRIEVAYVINLVVRIVLESVSIFVGFATFNIEKPDGTLNTGMSHFLWMEVPGMFHCHNTKNANLLVACYTHYSERTKKLNVPCWVSRPTEKTVLLRYMNILSFICVLISGFELAYLLLKFLKSYLDRRNRTSPSTDDQEVELDELQYVSRRPQDGAAELNDIRVEEEQPHTSGISTAATKSQQTASHKF